MIAYLKVLFQQLHGRL